MRAHLAWLHTADAGITAKRDSRHAKTRVATGEPNGRAGKTQHELGNSHAERTRRKIVPAFVNEHEKAQANGCVYDHKDDVQGMSFRIDSPDYKQAEQLSLIRFPTDTNNTENTRRFRSNHSGSISFSLLNAYI